MRRSDEGLRVVLARRPRDGRRAQRRARRRGHRRHAARARSPQPRAALPGDHVAGSTARRPPGGGGMSTLDRRADDGRRFAEAAQEARHADLGARAGAGCRCVSSSSCAAPQHSSDPLKTAPPAASTASRRRCASSRIFFGPLAAILIGTEAGAGDISAGVFRDLVVTGRSRLALFAVAGARSARADVADRRSSRSCDVCSAPSRSPPVAPTPEARRPSRCSASRCSSTGSLRRRRRLSPRYGLEARDDHAS